MCKTLILKQKIRKLNRTGILKIIKEININRIYILKILVFEITYFLLKFNHRLL